MSTETQSIAAAQQPKVARQAVPEGWKLVPTTVPPSAFKWLSNYGHDLRSLNERDRKIIHARTQNAWAEILLGITEPSELIAALQPEEPDPTPCIHCDGTGLTEYRPILFSAPMVRALLAGTKTQTRRTANKCVRHPDLGNLYMPGALVMEREPQHVIERACPYGQPGDQLWVRETHYAWGRWETRYSAKKGRDEWHFIDMTLECDKTYVYPASDRTPQPIGGKRQIVSMTPAWWKRPAIHIPRAASRITLEITGVRVERLQDISEADAKAEGCKPVDPCDHVRQRCEDIGCRGPQNYREGYRLLWEEINGPGSWDANPWVWVIEFRRVKP